MTQDGRQRFGGRIKDSTRGKGLEGSELIVDCSKKQEQHYQPGRINGTTVETVDFRYLGVHILQDLSWSRHSNSLAKKARQRLYHLRRLRDFRLPSKVLRNLYTCTIESILTGNITVWFGNSAKQDRQALQRVVRSAERITHTELPDLQTIYYKRCQTKARRIVKDPTHPSNRLFSPLSVIPQRVKTMQVCVNPPITLIGRGVRERSSTRKCECIRGNVICSQTNSVWRVLVIPSKSHNCNTSASVSVLTMLAYDKKKGPVRRRRRRKVPFSCVNMKSVCWDPVTSSYSEYGVSESRFSKPQPLEKNRYQNAALHVHVGCASRQCQLFSFPNVLPVNTQRSEEAQCAQLGKDSAALGLSKDKAVPGPADSHSDFLLSNFQHSSFCWYPSKPSRQMDTHLKPNPSKMGSGISGVPTAAQLPLLGP
ncbi:hypothetical protein P4O66_000007 [Electrophorus voltai]|uniref:Alkylated DNA repair protein AlkB homologue 8 N-terminal domain-containing protein n=1 Tax=Electrophorus voltai TaxID=2609070 RepID=A0AAD8ZW05_9TELE|nr:hypothetical protein P4O66_000007 [Electrophorus voltai]